MDQIKECAEKIPIYHRPYGFVNITWAHVGLVESYEGFFQLTAGTHSAEAYFLVTDMNRDDGCLSLSIFSPTNKAKMLLEVTFKKRSPNARIIEYIIVSSTSGIYLDGVIKILHSFLKSVICSRYPKDCMGPWITCLNQDSRIQLEKNLRSNIDTIVSSLQMLTLP